MDSCLILIGTQNAHKNIAEHCVHRATRDEINKMQP